MKVEFLNKWWKQCLRMIELVRVCSVDSRWEKVKPPKMFRERLSSKITMSLLKLGFSDGRYWDIVCSAWYLLGINTCERKRQDTGLGTGWTCIVMWVGLIKPLPLSMDLWTEDCLSEGLEPNGWASLLGRGLQLRWTWKEVTFGSCLLTVFIAGQQFIPWRWSLVMHLCVFFRQWVCVWVVLPQRAVLKYLEVFWLLQIWGKRVALAFNEQGPGEVSSLSVQDSLHI